jgi:4-hydroxybutyrate CoA-transferase
MKVVSAEEAIRAVKSDDRVFIHSAAAPQQLIRALTGRADELRDVEIVHLHTEGEAPYARPDHRESFHTKCLFT